MVKEQVKSLGFLCLPASRDVSLLSPSKASCSSGHCFQVFPGRPSWLPGTAVLPSHCGLQTPMPVCPFSAPDPLSPVRHELSCFRFWDTGHSAPSPSPNHAHHLQQFPVCTSPPSIIFFLQVWIFPLHSLLAVNIGVPQRGECKHLSLSRRHTPKLWFSFDLLDDEDSPFCI